jgi:hypothetical protein
MQLAWSALPEGGGYHMLTAAAIMLLWDDGETNPAARIVQWEAK